MDSTLADVNPFLVLGASLALVGASMAISWWLGLGVGSSIGWASVRAAIQLIAVGVLLTLVIDSDWEWLLAPVWIVAMIAIATNVVTGRSKRKAIRVPAALAITASTALSLVVVFGFGVLPAAPIQFIVVAGITIGNTLPATVVAADQVNRQLTAGRPVIEGLLALGIDSRRSTRYIVAEATRVALIPQIERTKVVGLVALPGAFTGLLIAGVAPFDAAIVQLVVMYLVLGSVAVSSSVVALASARSAFTPDQRLAEA
jgi:putative ABC transport system permease protein